MDESFSTKCSNLISNNQSRSENMNYSLQQSGHNERDRVQNLQLWIRDYQLEPSKAVSHSFHRVTNLLRDLEYLIKEHLDHKLVNKKLDDSIEMVRKTEISCYKIMSVPSNVRIPQTAQMFKQIFIIISSQQYKLKQLMRVKPDLLYTPILNFGSSLAFTIQSIENILKQIKNKQQMVESLHLRNKNKSPYEILLKIDQSLAEDCRKNYQQTELQQRRDIRKKVERKVQNRQRQLDVTFGQQQIMGSSGSKSRWGWNTGQIQEMNQRVDQRLKDKSRPSNRQPFHGGWNKAQSTQL